MEKLSLHRQGCVVQIPARTSVTVLDMNAFAPGTAGGGNVGFAIGVFTEISIQIALADVVLDNNAAIWLDERRSLLHHVLARWRAITGTAEHFSVTIRSIPPAHIGLASSASLQTAAWIGLNHLFGHPYSDMTVRSNIAASYRESEGSVLVTGFTTGLSSFLSLYGGFAVVDVTTQPIAHLKPPRWTAAIVAPPHLSSISFGEVERRTLTIRGPELDTSFRQTKHEIVTRDLIPAVTDGNLLGVGSAIARLQADGSKAAEIEIYGTPLSGLLAQLRQIAPCVFMSAVGPGVIVLSDVSSAALTTILQSLSLVIRWTGQLDNIGLRLAPME